jgi:hypothetical protein
MNTKPQDTLSIQKRKIWRYAGCSYIGRHANLYKADKNFARNVVGSDSHAPPTAPREAIVASSDPSLSRPSDSRSLSVWRSASQHQKPKDFSRSFFVSFEQYRSVMTVRLLKSHFSVGEVPVVLGRLRN